MRKRINNLFFVIGLTAVVIMLCTFHVSFTELWAYIRQADYWLAAILGLWFFLYLLNTWAWHIIIRGSGPCTISFLRLMKLTVTGFALNYATPMGMIGGEAYRIMELSRYIDTQRATSSVVLFVMMHVFSHFWFWMTSIVVYLILAIAGHLPLDTATGIVLLLAALFCCGGIYLFVRGYKYGMVVKLIRLIGKLPGLHHWGKRFSENHREDLQKIDRLISELHSQNKHSFFGSFFLEYVGRLLQSFEIFFMLMLFGINGGGGFTGCFMTFIHSFLILAFTSLFANLLGFLPLQLGGREGGFAMSMAQLGMTAGTAMFVSIICRVRELFWTSIGLLLMKIGNRNKTANNT
ncbi:MAG: flippase-like domain-containing protein [Prevotella sp.]|nr:flippase-like domain-containing protein [Prevotella sp.]